MHAVRLHEGLPSRFALVPRAGGEVRWFEAAPTYVLHWLNAFEEGGEVVLDGYFQEQPAPPPLAERAARAGRDDGLSRRPQLPAQAASLALRSGHRRDPRGTARRRYPRVRRDQPARAGQPYRFGWSMLMAPGRFLFAGFAKTDLATGETSEHRLAPGRSASEAPLIRARRRRGPGGRRLAGQPDHRRKHRNLGVLAARRRRYRRRAGLPPRPAAQAAERHARLLGAGVRAGGRGSPFPAAPRHKTFKGAPLRGGLAFGDLQGATPPTRWPR